MVRIEALGFQVNGTAGRETYRPPANYDAGTYTVQIGVYANAGNARRLSQEMKKLFGYSEVKSTTARGQRYYRVFAGRYSSFKAAEAAERNFMEHGYPASFVLSLE